MHAYYSQQQCQPNIHRNEWNCHTSLDFIRKSWNIFIFHLWYAIFFSFFFVNTNSCYSNASINLATLQTEHDDAHIYSYMYMHTSTASKSEEGKKMTETKNFNLSKFETRTPVNATENSLVQRKRKK